MKGFYLSIHQCPIHKDFLAVCLDEKDEDGGTGVRLTPSKCCGRWKLVTQWPMRLVDLRCIKEAIENAIEECS